MLINGQENAETLFILAHGAGADMEHEFMADMASRIAAQGICVVRFNFPYMMKKKEDGKKRPPDRQLNLIKAFTQVLDQFDHAKIVVGGKSMGGRMATYLQHDKRVQGIVCLGFPFHPPGKPEKTKGEHLQHISKPTCIVQGERDPFGHREELTDFPFSDQVEIHFMPDGDHSLKPRKRSGVTELENRDTAVAVIVKFIEGLSIASSTAF